MLWQEASRRVWNGERGLKGDCVVERGGRGMYEAVLCVHVHQRLGLPRPTNRCFSILRR